MSQVLTTTYRHNGIDYPIKQSHSLRGVVRRLISHNKFNQYTGVIEIGKSGSGKTTLTDTLIHFIHEEGETYVVKKFSQKDLADVDKIINSLVKGVKYIIIFDDASYSLEDLPKSEIAKLAANLTYIRHTVKNRVITIMNIHYSKAAPKFFRDVDFTFCTSMTVQEIGNYYDLFGYQHKRLINKFAMLYSNQLFNGFFDVPISTFEGKFYRYITHKPFRVVMVAEITRLHLTLVAKEECVFCKPQLAEKKLNAKTFVKQSLQSYPNTFETAMRYWALTNRGVDSLAITAKKSWNHINRTAHEYNLDWLQVINELNEQTAHKYKRGKQAHITKDDKDVMAQFAQSAEPNTTPPPIEPTHTDIPQSRQRDESMPQPEHTEIPPEDINDLVFDDSDHEDNDPLED